MKLLVQVKNPFECRVPNPGLCQLNLADNQVGERRLNLNRSWYKDHSLAYNTSFYFKSYTKDLSFPIFKMLLSPTTHHFQVGVGPCNSMILDRSLMSFFITWEKQLIATFSRDSDLEAFSRNPTHGSFSALTFQSTDLPIM